jgi:subtilase family serine protease
MGIGALQGGARVVSAQARALITAPVDETKLTTLKSGGQARLIGAKDLGTADVAKAAGRMIVVLKRSDEQESALQSFLMQAHQASSPQFHKWLTPGSFAQQYGAADADIAQVSAWLKGHGLKVAGVSAGKGTIEFSGNVGQVNEAFHTSIHQFSVKGETHYANATEPKIPTALAAAVAGVSPLNDFHAVPEYKLAGRTLYNPKTHAVTPQWTYGEGQGYAPFYFLTPEDFATQYDVTPAYTAGTTGAGVTIGIMNESNIDINLVNAYRKIFGLTANPPQVVIDGNDPGINGAAIEAYLDVENAGAVAPAATVKLYIAGSEGLLGNGGLTFAMLRAVNDDAASVLSLSFGTCEEYGTAYNEFINSVWEQAAAQGQTVMVSTGDSGSLGCYGLGVNGFASTPWDVGVGGTDAYLTDYATGGASLGTLWSSTNDASLGSLKTKMAEQPWNGTQFGLNSILYDPTYYQETPSPNQPGAGGGGASACAVGSTDPVTGLPICVSGYPKPSWQAGTGVPNDSVRDLPDVSLFASNGYNGVTYPICAEAGDCTETDASLGELYVTGVGGTSASAPAMAGIMALVNQKYGPQGQANFTMYGLAAQYPATFNDVTVGSNNQPCNSYDVGSPYAIGCAKDTNDSFYSYQLYSAGAGYDEASGLGTVDVNQMLTNWNKVTFDTSGTTLSLTPTTIVHGATVTASVAVTGKGTPAGAVGLVTSSPLPNNKGITYLELGSGGTASGTLNYLPGGTYTVVGQYSGDGINAASTSAPVTMTVSPEASTLDFTPIYVEQTGFTVAPITANLTVPYGSDLLMDVQINGANGTFDGLATGTVTFTDGATQLGTASISSGGTAEYNGSYLAPGAHSIGGSYTGDASYKAGTFGPIAFTVAKAVTFVNVYPDFAATPTSSGAYQYQAGQSATIEVPVFTNIQSGLFPTGTVTLQLGSGAPVTVPVVPNENLVVTGFSLVASYATDVLSNLQTGDYTLSVSYSGDANYAGSSTTQEIVVVAATLLNSTSVLTVVSPSSLSDIPAGTVITLQGTVTGAGSTAPTGTVTFGIGNALGYNPVAITPGTGDVSTVTFVTRAADLLPGNNTFTMNYSGDGVYAPSASGSVTLPNDNTDFSVQPLTPDVTIASGGNGTSVLSLAGQNGFSGAVALTCAAPASMTCSLSASSAMVSGLAPTTATLTVTAAASKTTAANTHQGVDWRGTGGVVVALLLICVVPKRRKLGGVLLSVVALGVLAGAVGCGGKSQSTGSTTATVDTPAGTYAVVVTGTAPSGIVHNAAITVIVH